MTNTNNTHERRDMKEVTEFDTVESLKDSEFNDLVKRRVSLKRRQDKLAAELKEINKDTLALMLAADVKKVGCNGYVISQVDGCSRSLSAAKLLEQGVDPVKIEAATKETRYTSLRISRRI